MTDKAYMEMALELARKGCGCVNPNPMVGAVVVKDEKIIGSGYHEKCGQLHAERNALAACTQSPENATMYVTLEPCCHHGKTPPCTQAIIESGIKRVVVGSNDPNPLVAGKGIETLRQNGIEVVTGVLADACDRCNAVFFHYIKTKTPFVAMKYAMTLDGKIATRTGKSKWITGEPARAHVQRLRHEYTGIMVGVNTVICDDPLLTCRMPDGRNPVRIICDTHLRTPLISKIVTTAGGVVTYIATACTDTDKQKQYTESGCKIILLPLKSEGRIDLTMLMQKLGAEGIDSILLEGGAQLNDSALRSGIVQKVYAYVSPKIFGGEMAKTPVGGAGVDLPDSAFVLKNLQTHLLGEDILIEGEVARNVYGNC